MPDERFPKQQEQQRTGGQHGTRNIGNVETEQAKRRTRESQRPGPQGSKDEDGEQGR
jgi:hypothetical protein